MEFRAALPWWRTRDGRPLVTGLVFADGGAAFLRKPLQTEEEKKRLLGVGFGLRWTFNPHATALLDIGFPAGDTSVEEDRPRAYYAVSLGL